MALFSLFAGCSSYTDLPPGTVKEVLVPSPVLEREEVAVTPLFQAEERPPRDYRVGPGDVLLVSVFGHPEMSSPGLTVGSAARLAGSRVDGEGFLQMPLVGGLKVSGLTVEEIRRLVEDRLQDYLQRPSVVVEISEFRSQPLYLLGQFNKPGTYYMERPLNLLEGLALGSGLNEIANLRSARLIRDRQTQPVDIYRLLQEGAQDQNVYLQAGDAIFVPDDRNQNVFVFGAVKKPGPVPMPNGHLTLAQALASAGIEGAGYNDEFVRIVRSLSPTRGELIVVDMRQILRGKALPFSLMEGDIVYVPRNALGNWNQALQEILPSLQTISAILQPFVQIKFLKE